MPRKKSPSAPRAISIPPVDFLLLFQKRPEPFTSLHPNKFLLIAWKSIFREGVVLRLSTPNITLTDLVVSSFFSYASLFISPSCLMHSSPYSSPCSAWLWPSFLLFHSATAMWLPSFPFHGYAWCMLLPHATRYQNILEHSSVNLVQTCTYICSSIKGHKCQPENSSLALLVFPLYSQWEYLQNRLLAPSVCPSLVFDSLEPQLTLWPFGLFQYLVIISCLQISLSHCPTIEWMLPWNLKPPVFILALELLWKTLRMNLWFNQAHTYPYSGQA